MKNKTIALIDPVGGKAGMDFYDISLLESIAVHGYKTYLFSNFEGKSEVVQVFQSFNNIGVNKVMAIFNNFYNFIKALVFCRKNNVSWLILHLFRGGLFDLVTIGLARVLGIRIMLIIHDVKSLDTLVFPLTRKIILTHFNFAKIVHNQFSYDRLAELIGNRNMGNTHIVPHGNYVSLFNNQPGNLKSVGDFFPVPGQRYLLFFGQLKKAKGLDVLISAMAIAKCSFHLVIAGKARDDDFSHYRNKIHKAGLDKRVTLITRFITNEERDLLFRSCEIVILPYKWVYQSGVLLMAMSYAKTVIASAIEPNRELIIDGQNGLLFESGNPDKLAILIEKLDQGIYNQRELGQNAYKVVEEGHNWLKIGRFYTEILET